MKRLSGLFLSALLVTSLAPAVQAADFSQSFSPETIGVGATSRLTYTISNPTLDAITDLAFSGTLPAGATIASAPGLANGCFGSASAPAGGTAITLTDGRLGAGKSCALSLHVTSAVPGLHNNVSGDLTGSDGNSGPSAATLTVNAAKISTELSFVPDSLGVGSLTIATLLITNPNGGGTVNGIATVFNLPKALTLTGFSATDCIAGNIVFDENNNSLSLNSFVLPNDSSCSVQFELVANHVGRLEATSSNISSSVGSLGYAQAALHVIGDDLSLHTSISPNPVAAGTSTEIHYTLTNNNRRAAVSDIAFTADLDAGLTGLTVSDINNSCGGNVAGTPLLSVSNISLAAGSSCLIRATANIPGGTPGGSYYLYSSDITGTLGGTPLTSGGNNTSLRVGSTPVLTKEFLSDTATGGDTVQLQVILHNPGNSPITNFTWNEIYDESEFRPNTLPTANFCGNGSSISSYPINGIPHLIGSSLNLEAGDSCTFTIGFTVPVGARTGTAETGTDSAGYPDPSGRTIDALVNTDTITLIAGAPGSLAAAPSQVMPGETIGLTFNFGNGPTSEIIDQDVYDDYSNISFNLDLDSVLTGLEAVNLPSNPCGTGSSITGTSIITLAGGSLDEAESCSFTVQAVVPASAAAGIYRLSDTAVSALVRGVTAPSRLNGPGFTVSNLTVALELADNPIAISAGSGTTATVSATLNNQAVEGVSAIGFILDLRDIPGASVGSIDLNTCGGTNSATGGATLNYSAGILAASSSCEIIFGITLATGTPASNYTLLASILRADFGEGLTTLPNTTTTLELIADGEARDLSPRNLNEPDPDGDGILTADEEPLGDVNNDGQLDALQGNVASIISPVTGLPVALTFDPACILNSFTMVNADSLPADGERVYPDGLANFDLACESTDITLSLPGGSLGSAYDVRKYGPIAPDFGGPSSWYSFTATIDTAAESLSFTLTDGALGDSTGDDGQLVDPVGAAAALAGSGAGLPVNNIWALLLTALTLLTSAFVWRQRQAKLG